jgi:hypothetical protein
MIITRVIAILCTAILISQKPYYIYAQQPPPAGGSESAPQKLLTAEQLDSLVAPIALYPDPILSQVLVASTYPLEIVEAGRWVAQNSNLKGKELADAAAKQSWDASVQALVVLPEVLNRLDQNVSWTADLGNAFLAQEQGVMDAVQRMRKRASDKGALQSTPQQTVSTTSENNQTYIVIQPASQDVVYVPEYNPVAVWGEPAYYPYPPIYYPPSTGAVIAASAISFGAGMAIGAFWGGGGWSNWGWNCGWGHNNVVVNRNFINNNHFNRVNVGNGNAWVHNPAHRGSVPYANRNVANRFGPGRGDNMISRPTAAQTQQRLDQLGQRGGQGNFGQRGNAAGRLGQGGAGQRITPGQGGVDRLGQGGAGQRITPGQGSASRLSPGGGDRIGNRDFGGGSFRSQGAFSGMDQGGFRSRMNSNRGFSSRGFGGFGGGGGFRGGGFRGGGRRR